MIKINGSHLEGGGQIIRTSLGFSVMSQKAFEASDIRKGRKEPGLKSQHLHGIKALKKISDAIAEGDELGSSDLKFWPRKVTSKNLEIDVGTAGSITLLMQSLMLPCIFSSKPITIKMTGGTDVPWSPSFDYFANVFIPQLARFVKIDAKLLKRGYYPKGNGSVEVNINPKFSLNDFESFSQFLINLKDKAQPFNLAEQGHLIHIKGISHASMDLQNAGVAERTARSAQAILARKFRVPIKISSEYQKTDSTGSGITLWAIFSRKKEDIDEFNPIRIGSDVLGERGKKSEEVGEECANRLISHIESKTPVDAHLCDQLLPFLALIGGKIKTSKITGHSRSNIYAIEQFMGSIFDVNEAENFICVK
jgi:RNA 3'-phosphate cyclase